MWSTRYIIFNSSQDTIGQCIHSTYIEDPLIFFTQVIYNHLGNTQVWHVGCGLLQNMMIKFLRNQLFFHLTATKYYLRPKDTYFRRGEGVVWKGPSLWSPSQHQLPYDENVSTMLWTKVISRTSYIILWDYFLPFDPYTFLPFCLLIS